MKRILSLIMVFALIVSLGAVTSGCNRGEKSAAELLKDQTIHFFTRSDLEPKGGTEVGDLRVEKLEEIKEKYGCEIKWSNASDITAQLITAASSGQKLGDVCQQLSHQVYHMMNLGDYFWSVEELGGDPTDAELFNVDITAYAKHGDKTYGWWYDPSTVGAVMVINRSILERNGGTMPYNLVEDNKWTFNEWKKIMTLCADPNQNILGGQRDQSSVYTYLAMNDTSLYAVDANGRHISNTADTKLVEVLEFLTDITVNDKIYKGTAGSWDEPQKEFAKGNLATANVGLYVCRDELPTNMSDQWGIMPLPIGPSGSGYKNMAASSNSFCIQKCVDLEYAKALFQLTNELFVYPTEGLDGLRGDYESFCPDKESVDNLLMLQALPLYIEPEFTMPDLRKYTDQTTIMGDLTDASNGTKAIRSTLDAMSPQIQSVLDEFYKQTPVE